MKHLVITSAAESPAAHAGCEGLGYTPFRLFETMLFDKLQEFDLGVIRKFTGMRTGVS